MDIIKKAREILLQNKAIVFAYVFGSYVQNKIRKDSDIDLAIYLEDELGTYEYLELKMLLSEAFNREVDLVILNKATPLLKYEIYKNNILLFSNDKAVENKYKIKTLFEYNDMKKYLDLAYEININRLKEEVKLSDEH